MTAVWHRGLRLIENMIGFLKLDLTGKIILTEVGSNAFLFTPIIAAKAGASKVYAWCRDTRYGKASDIISECKQLMLYAGIHENAIEFNSEQVVVSHIQSADIITNSGFLRPLNKEKLQWAKGDAVIPVMYEKWELRPADIDVEYCKQKNIKIAGTWENFPGLNIFDYCEQLIIKLAFEAGIEIKNNRIVVWSDDHFGELAEKGFTRLGATVIKTTSVEVLYNNVKDIDAIFFCDYTSENVLIGEHGLIDVEKISKENPSLIFIHLAGKIKINAIPSQMKVYPGQDGESHRMTYTLSYLGMDPAIRLLTAGFKVGELLSAGNFTNHQLVQPIVQ